VPPSAVALDAEVIRESARGCWRSMIYPALGIEVGNGKHVPCPHCGGKDRFRCDDKDGSGSWYCNQCDPHAGDGFALIMKVRGCDFPTALDLVAGVLHVQSNGTGQGLGKIVAVHDFTDEIGTLLYQECRYEPKDFRLRRPDGKGGWISNLDGVQRVLKNLPLIHQNPKALIIHHEGPRCTEAAINAGLAGVHTTTCSGANSAKKTDFSPMKGRDVVIVPDNDEPGEKYLRDVAEMAHKAEAKTIKILRLPKLPPKGDVIQWIDAGGTPEQFAKLLEVAEPVTGETLPTGLASALLEYATLVTLDFPTRKHYLPWLPERANVMAYGPRGIGKTFFELGLSASLVTGTPFLKWTISEPVGVLYIDGEMQLDELRERMTNLLPEPPKAPLHFLSSEMVYHRLKRDLILSSEEVRDEVIGILDAHPEIRVLVFDNISTLFTGIDEDKKREWEPIAGWLIRLRHRGLATVLVHHAGKGGTQRGTSGREDALDTVIALSRPSTHEAKDGCHFEVKFEKCRSVKGDDVGPLDVKLLDTGKPLTWAYKDLEKSKEEQVKELLEEGLTSNAEIAEALGITRAYVWKLRMKIEKGDGK
jgi:DNA-binding CsgD family transcriptional regulator